MQTRVAAVLFDLDGTLLDTLQDLADSSNAALERLGLAPHPVEAYRHFVGSGMSALVQRILPKQDSEAKHEQCLTILREEYGRRWDATSRPYDGIAFMLNSLFAEGIPLAVLSNKPHDFTCLTVERLLADWAFAHVRGVDEATPPKPDPTGALAVSSILGVDPTRCLYVGDTSIDMMTAQAAGMISVGVTWGFRDEEELRTHHAQHIIHEPGQLLDLT
ncbi:MAG: HAD family hydrolase [Candidatus Latescibacterota bacterium]|nr:HAD family hydrolase [Candidatus Latescibacterota bacterium]MEE3335442.1 HAD family hydrolase [Candidatus Latescibacterota bacterium]